MIKIQKTDIVQYLGVEFSLKGVANVYGVRIERFIPRDEIRELRLKYGYPGERRWLQIPLGTILVGWAAVQILILLIGVAGGGLPSWRGILIPITLICVGGWLVRDATRSQWYIEVETMEKKHKLAFERNVDIAFLEAFLDCARQLGYVVDSSLLKTQTTDGKL